MWLFQALRSGLYTLAVSLMVVGSGAVFALSMLVSGHWGAEEIMTGVAWLSEAKAIVANVSGGYIVTLLARYGLPHAATLWAERQRAHKISLAEEIAEMITRPRKD